jgi:hypothetical protein
LAAISALERAGVPPVAKVLNLRGATDLVVAVSGSKLGIVSCVTLGSPEDRAVLENLVEAGDFVWAGLVYEQSSELSRDGPIESFHVSELDRLVRRLAALREALRDAC